MKQGIPDPGLDQYIAYPLAQTGFLVTVNRSSVFSGETLKEEKRGGGFLGVNSGAVANIMIMVLVIVMFIIVMW